MPRITLPINQDWFFETYKEVPEAFSMQGEPVCLPHTWNVGTNQDYHRGTYAYTKELVLDRELKGNELYLEFLGANIVCTVYLNQEFIGTHRGGYSTFRFDITNHFRWDGKNLLTVLVDNRQTEDVSPLMGDFTMFGGIYREVNVIAVPKIHFDLLHYGSPGIKLLTEMNGEAEGVLTLEAFIKEKGCETVTYSLYDPSGNLVLKQTVPASDKWNRFTISDPVLWNGMKSPALYRLQAVLSAGGQDYDEIELTCGFRYFKMTADGGMYLNGEHIRLHGVGIHQDREGCGNAVERKDREEDFALIRQMGADMIRLTHYPHAPYIYDMCDRDGFVVWSEIPLLSLTDNKKLFENACQQLTELILQNCHHPSVFFWGIQNEIAMFGENSYMYETVEKLNVLARELDGTRLTACANLKNVEPESKMNRITDIVGYNLYYGWYYGEIQDYQDFFDRFRKENPDVCLGISEYGVDCNLGFHSDAPKRKDYSEEYQCLFHEKAYGIFENNPWLWGSVIWNMFDFGSAIRDEGGTKGKNAKGLVSYDRSIKKDAFYYYKACWSSEPFVHVTGRRYDRRWQKTVEIKVYSNQSKVGLYVNGKSVGELTGERIFIFKGISLLDGENRIEAVCGGLHDEIILKKVQEPVQEFTYIDPNPGFNVKNWFLDESEELSQDLYYSLWDTVGALKENPDAWKILKDDLPRLWEDPTFEKRVHYELFKLINRRSSAFDESKVKEVNEKLMKIRK
ncbi:glycoside hydrolase family 2 protein [Lacrimispora amygdalina]|uniref:Glycoside hydrolase family 2 protein n=1 Tax=Lacrimispora amygdalina TaxID=253257 RepID=A0A3E2N665_9FIRM|nr:glycoside hydrolase family 2 TIM barrel-domain containing protein [Clostridium indicum]RFZ76488.1 glycoside hydrolase family 2 protein [Clostridium indicum]